MSEPAFEPPEFAEVTIGSRAMQPCSPPSPGPGWSGVALAAPVRVHEQPGRPTSIPVCGRFYVPLRALQDPVGHLHIRIHGMPPLRPQAVGLDDPANESGPAPPLDHPGNPAHTREVGGFFAVDIARFVTLPRRPATIDFSIEFGGHMSPVQTVEWAPATPPARAPR